MRLTEAPGAWCSFLNVARASPWAQKARWKKEGDCVALLSCFFLQSLQHPQLLAEVLSQLSFFKPNPKLIKKRLEHLIEREFIERDRDNPNLYRYMA